MTDELDRIRELRGDGPGPSRRWVDDTRDELLHMAAEESQARFARAAEPEPAGPWSRLLGFLRSLTAPRAAAWAAAAVVMVAILAGSVFVLTRQGATGPPRIATPATPTTPAPTPSDGERPSPQPPEGMVLAAACTGGNGLYGVRYPEDWHTAGTGDGCEFFDDEPIDPEEGVGGGPLGAITIRSLPVRVETAADPGRENREISSEQVTVDGRRAVTTVWESTGRAALPEGLRSYRYLVDLGDRTLLAVVYDADEAEFEERRQLLDAMVSSLEIDDTPAGA